MRRILAAAVLAFCACGGGSDPDLATGCRAAGGTVSSVQCCAGASEFPSTCKVGACGCSLENSTLHSVCHCPTGMCFDGVRCVLR